MLYGVLSSYSEMILIIHGFTIDQSLEVSDGNLYKQAHKDKTYGGIKPIHTAAIGGRIKTVAGAPEFHKHYHWRKDKTFKIRQKNTLHQIYVKCLSRQSIYSYQIKNSLASTHIHVSLEKTIKGMGQDHGFRSLRSNEWDDEQTFFMGKQARMLQNWKKWSNIMLTNQILPGWAVKNIKKIHSLIEFPNSNFAILYIKLVMKWHITTHISLHNVQRIPIKVNYHKLT